MSTIDKLIERMMTIPKDFRVSECDRVMAHFGYRKHHSRGGSSGIKYIRPDGSVISFHLPHKERGYIK